MLDQVRAELAPSGVLRAGINLSNFLLVTGQTASGDPQGVSPDMARALAERLDVPIEYIQFATPGELADAAVDDLWDIGNIGAEPERVVESIVHLGATRLIGHTVQVTLGIGILVVDRRRQDPVFECHYTGDTLDGSSCAQQMPRHRLGRTNSH